MQGEFHLLLVTRASSLHFFVCGMYNRVLDETRFQSANITDIVVCIPGTRRWVMSIECAEFKRCVNFFKTQRRPPLSCKMFQPVLRTFTLFQGHGDVGIIH